MKFKIPQLQPFIGKEELENLETSIKNKWITEGPFSEELLDLIKSFTGSKHALFAPNGTLGLFLGLLGIEIEKGDEVIVPNFTFNASGSSVVFAGAKPVFVDVNIDDYHILPEKIIPKITNKTKAIMPVHIYGQSADLNLINKIAEDHKLKVIEDAAQSLGVFYNNQHTGTFGDVGVISFFADKTITMGEGAVILTNNDDIYEKIKFLRNQGRPNSGTFIHPFLGMNFRVTDLQCGVGVAQFKKFETIKNRKIENYNLYKENLNNIDEVIFVNELDYCNFVPFRAPIRVRKLNKLIPHLESKGIQSRGFFYPMHKQPCYASFDYANSEFKNSNKLFNEGLALPVYPDLKKQEILTICSTIKKFYQ